MPKMLIVPGFSTFEVYFLWMKTGWNDPMSTANFVSALLDTRSRNSASVLDIVVLIVWTLVAYIKTITITFCLAFLFFYGLNQFKWWSIEMPSWNYKMY